MERRNRKHYTGLRGYACLLVFISHCGYGVSNELLNKADYFGAAGVSIFIMLSGFLLMENHHDQAIDIISYTKRKISKFYPLHIVSLLAAVPLSIVPLINFDLKAYLGLICNLTLTQAWIPEQTVYFSYNAVSWYLSLVVFFAIASPAILCSWNKVKTVRQTICVLTVCTILEIFWCFLFSESEIAHWVIYIFPGIRIIDFILGCGVWKLVDLYKKGISLVDISHLYFEITSLVLIAFILITSLYLDSVWYLSVIWIVPAMMLLMFSTSNTKFSNFVLSNKMITAIGNISFELFLIHQLTMQYLFRILGRIGFDNWFIIVCLYFFVATLLSFIWRKVHTSVSKSIKVKTVR